jgi:hypothetical protein
MRDKEILGLYEAYLQVYMHQEVVEEVEELDEAREASHDPEGYEERQRKSQSSRQRRMNDPHTGINSPAFHAFMAKQMGGKKKKKDTNEQVEVDLFDIILEHLVAEGYADTEEAATVIMANMSEEWREEILDESRGAELRAKHGDNPSKKLETKAFRKAMSYDNRDRLPTGTGTEVRGRYLGLSGRARSRAGGETPASSAVGPRGESRTVRSRGGRSAGIGAGENRDRPAG